MSPRLGFAVETARLAGNLTLAHFRNGVPFERKADESPVTVADREAEAFVRRRIAERYPDDAVLGEEQGGVQRPDQWVVDPIDGTKSFIAGVPAYAVLISYEQDGEPVLGVCHMPALGETIYAEKGDGCFWQDRPCCVSQKTRIEDSILCTGSLHSMEAAGRLRPMLTVAERALGTRGWGDAYGHALVATGRVEAMVDPIVNRWDISAMAVIVREAGGSFTDFRGREELSNEAVSCAPGVKEELLEAFRS
ncbi:MAG TPA: inositol monophosphatase family protein [Fimbriimonadaceae bacterium]|nr:inositol monophosphatase family protein [Fimbriimonadaceae bacterium]